MPKMDLYAANKRLKETQQEVSNLNEMLVSKRAEMEDINTRLFQLREKHQSYNANFEQISEITNNTQAESLLFAIGDYLDLASETSLLLKHQDTVMKEIEAIQNTLNILAEQESRLLLNVKNHLAEYVNMKARNIKFVYVAIVTVSILIVFFLVFPYFQTNSVDISINIATEFLGAILTFVIFDIFYRRLENRYREANKLYDEMTEVVVKHQDTVSIALNRIENETTKLTNLSQSSNQLRSNVETSIKSVRDLQDRIKTYISRNETSPDSD